MRLPNFLTCWLHNRYCCACERDTDELPEGMEWVAAPPMGTIQGATIKIPEYTKLTAQEVAAPPRRDLDFDYRLARALKAEVSRGEPHR